MSGIFFVYELPFHPWTKLRDVPYSAGLSGVRAAGCCSQPREAEGEREATWKLIRAIGNPFPLTLQRGFENDPVHNPEAASLCRLIGYVIHYKDHVLASAFSSHCRPCVCRGPSVTGRR